MEKDHCMMSHKRIRPQSLSDFVATVENPTIWRWIAGKRMEGVCVAGAPSIGLLIALVYCVKRKEPSSQPRPTLDRQIEKGLE